MNGQILKIKFKPICKNSLKQGNQYSVYFEYTKYNSSKYFFKKGTNVIYKTMNLI